MSQQREKKSSKINKQHKERRGAMESEDADSASARGSSVAKAKSSHAGEDFTFAAGSGDHLTGGLVMSSKPVVIVSLTGLNLT
jgi:hypothetical protein